MWTEAKVCDEPLLSNAASKHLLWSATSCARLRILASPTLDLLYVAYSSDLYGLRHFFLFLTLPWLSKNLFVIYINSSMTLWKILKKTFILLAPPTAEDCIQSMLSWAVPKGLARIWGTPKMSWKTLHRILGKTGQWMSRSIVFLGPSPQHSSASKWKHYTHKSLPLSQVSGFFLIITCVVEVLFPQSVGPTLGNSFKPNKDVTIEDIK